MPPTEETTELFDRDRQRVLAALNTAGNVFSSTDLRRLRSATVGKKVPEAEFLELLIDRGLLERIELRSDRYSGFVRLVRPGASAFEIALSLRTGSYLSHGTAVFLHGLTQQAPAKVFANREQSPKPKSESGLTQAGIDRAFVARQREAKYILSGPGFQVVLLNGKATNDLEVGELRGPSGESLRVTKLERTLIDITVRPTYAGGVFQVLEAFREARRDISVGVLLSTLKKLDHVYPYHQAIGFYMERAGFEDQLLKRVESLGMQYDFYIAHGLRKKNYSSRWKVFYPDGL